MTMHNPTPSYANLWKRLLAFGLDYIVISAYLLLIVGLSLTLNATAPNLLGMLFGSPLTGELSGFLLITLPVTLYFALFESSSWQATWGKRALKLKVVDANGAGLSWPRALARTALKFIPWELSHACIWQITFAPEDPSPLIWIGFGVVWFLVGVNLVSVLFSKTRQSLYDRLAGTWVVNV